MEALQLKKERIKQLLAQKKAEKEAQNVSVEFNATTSTSDTLDSNSKDTSSNSKLSIRPFKLKKTNTTNNSSSSSKRNVFIEQQELSAPDELRRNEEENRLQKKARIESLLRQSDFNSNNATSSTTSSSTAALKDVDSLEDFMNSLSVPKSNQISSISSNTNAISSNPPVVDSLDNEYLEESESDFSLPDDITEDLDQALKKTVKRKLDLGLVDHSKIAYPPFRKSFYMESKEIKEMTEEQVQEYREKLDHIKIWGPNCPRPIQRWTQCGLPLQCEVVLKNLMFNKPTPIQAQAIPAIMSGRDVIGVAKTGSGKTLAFLLPMFRHIKDQPPCANGDGPIAVVLTPTRELAMQIHSEAKRFCKIMNIRVNCSYGGAPLQQQIAETKRGSEILISTPGRFIDLLSANAGRVTNLRRCTYLVLDEADRMFDMGFEQQVMKIVQNVRPKAQRVLFSATFPKQMEVLARKMLKKPLEITVGGKSIVANTITQNVVLIDNESDKFVQLLSILGNWYNHLKDQRCLVFVDRQEAADNLLRELLRRGYPCCSLHGGKEQTDRDSTISHFKNGTFQIMVATSVAARGLDVKECNLVINYDCPNHMEDYVHRVGRTGRAGRKGTAYTFVTHDQDKFTPDIVKALKGSKSKIPPELQEMADAFMERVRRGEAVLPSSGFGGKGLEQMEKERDNLKRAQQLSYGDVDDMLTEDEEELAQVTGIINTEGSSTKPEDVTNTNDPRKLALLRKAEEVNAQVKTTLDAADMRDGGDAIERLNITLRDSPFAVLGDGSNFSVELEINDYPVPVRQKLLSKEFHDYLHAGIGVVVIVRGKYYPEGTKVPESERKLHMIVTGDSRNAVASAKMEIVKAAKDVAMENGLLSGIRGTQARYNVI